MLLSTQRTRNKLMQEGPSCFRMTLLMIFSAFLIVSCFHCRQSLHHVQGNERWRDLITEDMLKDDQGPQLKTTENEVTSTSKYAYASLMASCDPENQEYLGMMFNAIAAFEVLRDSGSTADFVLMVRMAASTKMESLPEEEEESIRKAGLKVMYLPKPTSIDDDNYLTAQMDKFHALNLYKHYREIIVMDADIMPLCNLDFFFKASRNGIIKKNFIISERMTPANGGFFMLSLGEGDHQRAYDIIKSKKSPFDKEIGWGHKIEHPDYYRFRYNDKPRHHWTFNAAPADQGFLYYWVKYIKKSVTISVNSEDGLYEDWSSSQNGNVVQTYNGSKHIPSCQSAVDGNTPWFHHFFGGGKPWVIPSSLKLKRLKTVFSLDQVKTPHEMWWYYLLKANKSHGLELKVHSIKPKEYKSSLPLGSWTPKNAKMVNNFD